MPAEVAGPEIERLIQLLARLPGLGPRSARRAALHLIRKREQLLSPLAEAMKIAEERIRTCSACGNVDTRDARILVVVETVGDLWALERAQATRGLYHVLGGTLSPLDGVGPEDLSLDRLSARVEAGGFEEIVLAVNATVDGQTTAHFITDLLAPYSVKITRLAHGVPVGGELDYLDDGTLSAAMKQRTAF
jgi:recombination protein RecR